MGEITALSVLIVEDHEPMRALLRAVLERAGVSTVRDAANGEAGLALLAEHGADLILVDQNMPRMDGRSLIERARAAGSSARIIMITGRADATTAEAARAAGADAVLVKPIGPRDLLEAIERVLSN